MHHFAFIALVYFYLVTVSEVGEAENLISGGEKFRLEF